MTQAAPFDAPTWWASLKHGGMLIAPARLVEFFAPDCPPLPRHLADRVRRDLLRVRNGDADHLGVLLDTVLEEVFGLDRQGWTKAGEVDTRWSHKAVTGEIVKPRRVWQAPSGAEGDRVPGAGVVLPVFVADSATTGDRYADEGRLGIGRGRRPVARVIEWLRRSGEKIALLTNGRQWRLLHAGADYDSWCESDTDLWFEEGVPGLQVTALRILLGEPALRPTKPGEPPPLIAAILASRRGQADLSAALGERVRLAVELLIRESAGVLSAIDGDGPDPRDGAGHPVSNVSRRDLYIAATRLVMRCVVVLFAEARDLLPRYNAIYHECYGAQGLREQLARLAGGRAERLRYSHSGWPRLLALFRLVHQGSPHEALPIPRYGGGLFAPGDRSSKDAVLRALAAFEDPRNAPTDAATHEILELLCVSKVKVRQGRSSTWVPAPVDFSDLSSEYIGILYEGLLDFELRRVPQHEPMVFLNLGDQPALPFLSGLTQLTAKARGELLQRLKTTTKKISGDGEDEEGGENDDEEEVETEVDESDATAGDEPAEADAAVDRQDERLYWTREVMVWVQRAVRDAGWTKRGADLNDPEVASLARTVCKRIVLPGEYFLVRWGGTRKGAGTFYTRPQLAVPTARRALQSLCYEAAEQATDEATGITTVTKWVPRRPEDILALKVCDPAMGSGSFLIAALRYLTDALGESLHFHKRLHPRSDGAICKLADGLPLDHPSQETVPVPLDHPEFDERLRARLKRHVVERCIYGVDIDPLAVELARMALWVETMDRRLPFGFLDHKLRCGNSLVGCWFDRFQDYPVMAFERDDAGDKNHTWSTGSAAGEKGVWTKRWKAAKNDTIKPEVRRWIEARGPQQQFFFAREGHTPESIHDEALAVFRELHDLPVHEVERREQLYREKIADNPALARLREAFDTWCAIWFWPGDKFEVAPTPKNFQDPPEATRAVVARLRDEHMFFHWELEFPDVFTGPGSGFDVVLGNPPWETLQPNSKEFFSNIDPLYRAYGKREALSRQVDYFTGSADVEHGWLSYCARLKGLATWTKHVATPFGDGDGVEDRPTIALARSLRESQALHDAWRAQRRGRASYADAEHPFRHQGAGKPYTYKLFAEMAYAALRPGGRIGFLLPAGIYTDKGAAPLRRLFLSKCDWAWLFGFENRQGIFDIHRSFKFNSIVVRKGGQTSTIRTAFMHRSVEDWQDAERHALPYPRERIERFSPKTLALVEFRSARDVDVASRVLDHSTYLSAELGPGSLAVTGTSQGDINLTSEVRRAWHATSAEARAAEKQGDLLLCASGKPAALPIYQGAMIHQMDPLYGAYESGFGHNTKWRPLDWNALEPQFWGPVAEFDSSAWGELRLLSRRVINATNERSMIAALIPAVPSSDTTLVYATSTTGLQDKLSLVAVLNSFVFDWMIRLRIAGATGATALDFDRLQELPVPADASATAWPHVQRIVARLNLCHRIFGPQWLKLREALTLPAPGRGYARSDHERLRVRCIADAVVGALYGLDFGDLAWILRDCDHPAASMRSDEFTRALDQKGFWRIDKERDPELRHTVLTLAAFHELKRLGLDAFLALNDGEGWMLPETLRLADYGLGHDDRAKEAQPVVARLGPRFLPWQLEQGVEESWQECARHAERIDALLGRAADPPRDPRAEASPKASAATDLFGQPLPTDLFGNVIEERPRRRR